MGGAVVRQPPSGVKNPESGLGGILGLVVSSVAGDFGQGALSESWENGTMETWDIVLLVVAGYVATFGLARLMTRRREQLIEDFRERMEQGQTKSVGEEAQSSSSRPREAA